MLSSIETDYETVKTIKHSERGSVSLLQNRQNGTRFIFRHYRGNGEVYRKLLGISCPNLPQIMEAAEKCISHLEFLEANGSVMAVSDVGVAVQFIRTALTGAVMNVYINTKSMKQRNEAEKINQKAEKLLEEGTKRADLVYEKVLSRLKK